MSVGLRPGGRRPQRLAALQELREDGCLADVHVASCGDEGHDAALHQVAQLFQRRATPQFSLVARGEFVEPVGPMAVPLAQLLRRRDILAPDTHPRVIFAHSARPNAIDQDPLAVVGTGTFVDPRYPDPLPGAHIARLATRAVTPGEMPDVDDPN